MARNETIDRLGQIAQSGYLTPLDAQWLREYVELLRSKTVFPVQVKEVTGGPHAGYLRTKVMINGNLLQHQIAREDFSASTSALGAEYEVQVVASAIAAHFRVELERAIRAALTPSD